MKNLTKLAGVALFALAALTTAKADPFLTGSIQFSGNLTITTALINPSKPQLGYKTGLGNALAVNFSSMVVTAADGVYAGTVGHTVVFTPSWTIWDGDGDTGAVNNFWSVDGFTFDLTDAHVLARTNNDPSLHKPWLLIGANGVVSADGYADTAGYYQFTTSGSGTTVTNSQRVTFKLYSYAANMTSVPDGGTTALLVGLGLVGMSLVARRRK